MNDRPAADRQQLERALAAQEGLRGVVPDEIVDAAITALLRQLDGDRDDSQRRRQVTVMFADVSGFTPMSSRLDPEAVAEVMNELWSSLDAIITEHGGHVDKHIGDAVMAVWGVASTQEDDPERAVSAGLAMQEELVRRDAVDRLSMRVGINTGPAHLGVVGASAEFTAMGDTVNVASRVQNFAPLGGVLVTHDTYRHIRGVFDVDELDAAEVKGKDEPIRVYVVRRAKERAFRTATRGVEGVETRMVGRVDELDVLQREFESVVAESATRAVTIIGDAGIGKSRLLYEFENWIELHPARAYFFKGRALATHRSAAFGLARDLVGDRFGVTDSDPAFVVAEKMRVGLGPTLTAGEAEIVGHLLGFDLRSSAAVQSLLGSGQLAATARAHLFRYFEALASSDPVVIFLEDLHWADDESLALFEQLVAQVATVHLLLVGAARPALLERPEAGGISERSSRLRLEPLGAGATRALVEEVLQKAGHLPPDLTDLIVGRADGNAFYVEELVKMLIEDGVIEVGEPWDPWRVHVERLDAERVPATLTGVLQTRIDSLARPERDALQRSSVVGRVFWDGTVATLGEVGVEATTRSLEIAHQRELVLRRERSSFDDSVEYAFKHALLRDVTYETVLLRDRQRLHRLVAQWIADRAGERLTEFAGLIATHYRLAGELPLAADLLVRAAVASLDAGIPAGARRNLEEAFELWQAAEGEPTVEALITMAEACVRLGDIAAARRYDDDALQRAVTPDDRCMALYLGSWIASEAGEHDRERAMLDEALPAAETHGGRLLGRVLCGISWSAVVHDDAATAKRYAEQASELAGSSRELTVQREVLGLLGSIAILEGDYEGSLRHSTDALALALDVGDLDGQALAHSNIGVGHHLLGDANHSRDDYLAARENYTRTKSVCRRLGNRLREGMAAANLAQIHIRLGDDSEARRLLHEALILVRETGGRTTLLFCALVEADRCFTNGDDATALELIGFVDDQPELGSSIESEIARILGRSGLATEAIDQGMAKGAGQDFDAAIDRLIRG